MTNLITATELKTQARLGGSGLIQSNTDLETQITNSQNELEVRTGRKFNVQTITEYFNRHSGSLIQLNYYPVTSITTLKIDDTTIASTDYDLNLNLGSVYLHTALYNQGDSNLNNVEITYTTKAPDDAVLAKTLCADMALLNLRKQGMDNQAIQAAQTDIDTRINYLRREVMVII